MEHVQELIDAWRWLILQTKVEEANKLYWEKIYPATSLNFINGVQEEISRGKLL